MAPFRGPSLSDQTHCRGPLSDSSWTVPSWWLAAVPVLIAGLAVLSGPEDLRGEDKVSRHPPLEQLVPVAPKTDSRIGPLLTDDLTQVPEVAFQQAPAKGVAPAKTLDRMTEQMAAICRVNEQKTDQFMEALLARRSDLAGLPFVLGDACRTRPGLERLLRRGDQAGGASRRKESRPRVTRSLSGNSIRHAARRPTRRTGSRVRPLFPVGRM